MKKRLVTELLAGAALLGAAGYASRESKEDATPPVEALIESPKQETASTIPLAEKQIEHGPESDPIFQAEHPIEAELRTMILGLSESKRAQALLDLQTSFKKSDTLIREHRFTNAQEERKTFAACYDQSNWQNIVKSIRYASEKTGVPFQTLVAMGFIESKFNSNASREDTKVHGAFQMTLDTAIETAKFAREVYGFPIQIKGTEDLKDVKTSVRLAALRLKILQDRYGQLGLAVAAYAGGHGSLEKKIKQAFPKIDLGEKDWKEMERSNFASVKAKKTYETMLRLVKAGTATKEQQTQMTKSAREMSVAREVYTKAKNSWAKKRKALPMELKKAGVSIVGLYKHAEKSGVVPHSISYPMALDEIGQLAKKHETLAKKSQEKKLVKTARQ